MFDFGHFKVSVVVFLESIGLNCGLKGIICGFKGIICGLKGFICGLKGGLKGFI